MEACQIETASYQAQQSIGYHLQLKFLGAIYGRRCYRPLPALPDLADFREPQHFFSAKGTKLQLKTSRSGAWKSLLDATETDEGWIGNIQPSDEVAADNFASKRSIYSEGKNPDQQPSALEHVQEKLYDQLIGDFHGCPQQQHDEKLVEHMEAGGDSHYGLDEILNDPSFPSVLCLSNMISPQ